MKGADPNLTKSWDFLKLLTARLKSEDGPAIIRWMNATYAAFHSHYDVAKRLWAINRALKKRTSPMSIEDAHALGEELKELGRKVHNTAIDALQANRRSLEGRLGMADTEDFNKIMKKNNP